MTPAELRRVRIWLSRLRTRAQDAGVAEIPYGVERARQAVREGIIALHLEDGATLLELDLLQVVSRIGRAAGIDDRTVDRMLLELDRIAVERLVSLEVEL